MHCARFGMPLARGDDFQPELKKARPNRGHGWITKRDNTRDNNTPRLLRGIAVLLFKRLSASEGLAAHLPAESPH